MKTNNIVSSQRRTLLMGMGAASLLAVTACGGGGGSAPVVPEQPVVVDPPVQPPAADLKKWQAAEERLREEILRGQEADGVEILEPKLALDGNRGGMAIWLRRKNDTSTLWASRMSAAGDWLPADQIDGAIARDAAAAQIAMDAAGNAFAVWERRSTVGIDIGVARFDVAAQKWDDAFVLQRNTQSDATAPRIAMHSATGNAVVVWSQVMPGEFNARILSNVYTAGDEGGWLHQDLVIVEPLAAEPSTNPQVALDAEGNALAVWQSRTVDQSGYLLSSSRLPVGAQAWDAVMYLPTDVGFTGSNEMPHLAVAPDGTATVVWQLARPNEETGIFARRLLPDATAWEGHTTVVAPSNTKPANPQVAMDALGNTHVVWDEANAQVLSTRSIMASRFIVEGDKLSWSPAVSLERVRGGESKSPRLAFDADGNGLAVWEHFDGTHFSVLSARYQVARQEWTSTGVSLESTSKRPGDSSAPQLAIRPEGTAVAVWGRLEDAFSPGSQILSATSIWSSEFK